MPSIAGISGPSPRQRASRSQLAENYPRHLFSSAATIDGTDDFENSYTYDQLNRLTRVDQIGITGGNTVSEKRVDFGYKVDGRFETIARYNDTAGLSTDELATSNYTYDTLGRLTGLDYEQGGTDLFTPYAWTHDDLSRITQFTSADGTSDYTYDQTDQLTAATHSYQTDESYSYGANGNRTNTGYTTGSDNRLTNDGTYSYTYDDEGNRTKRTHDTTSDETLYEWDFRNRLTKVTEKDGTGTTTKVVEYTYDVFDRRIGKEVDAASPFDMADAAIERYVYDDLNGVTSIDGGNVALDFVDPDGTGATTISLEKRRLFGNTVDQILAEEDVTELTTSADRVYWPLVDHLGTVRDLAKNDGTLGEHYKYDAFGNLTSGNTALTRYLYTSREHDADTGLQYNRARWYDAAVGRWISQDPIGFAAGDANLYRYVGNSVTRLLDPSGLQEGQEGSRKPSFFTEFVEHHAPFSSLNPADSEQLDVFDLFSDLSSSYIDQSNLDEYMEEEAMYAVGSLFPGLTDDPLEYMQQHPIITGSAAFGFIFLHQMNAEHEYVESIDLPEFTLIEGEFQALSYELSSDSRVYLYGDTISENLLSLELHYSSPHPWFQPTIILQAPLIMSHDNEAPLGIDIDFQPENYNIPFQFLNIQY